VLRSVFEHLPLKIMSLALAFLLWFVISGEKSSERGVQAPLELQNFPRDLEVTNEPVDSVEVRVRATPGIIQRLAPGDVSAHVDVADAVEGERIVHLTESSLRLPFGVKVVQINPSNLTLNFERTLSKMVPVRARLLGRPQPASEIGEIKVEPAMVRVAGPRSRVQEVESAFTEPVSVDKAVAAVTQEVTVGLEDPLLRLVDEPRVRVTVDIHERHDERRIESVRVQPRNGTAIPVPETVTVVLGGPASVLATYDAAEAHAFVNATAGAGAAPVSVEIGTGHPGLVVVRTEPAQVTLRPARGRRKG
jgi:YbbR domain-containing protein